jgi:hypothetical protein
MEPRTFIIETPEQQARFAVFIGRQKGLPLECTVKDYVPRRSLEQNKRLWALHTMASAETGYTPEEMHDLCLCQHYGFSEREVKDPFTGQVDMRKTPLKRSSQRDKKEFRRFLDFVEDYYAENLGVWLNPDE